MTPHTDSPAPPPPSTTPAPAGAAPVPPPPVRPQVVRPWDVDPAQLETRLLGLLRQGGTLVVPVPSWLGPPVRDGVLRIRSVSDRRRLVAFATPLPPLALALLCTTLDELFDDEPEAAMVAALPHLHASVVGGATLRRARRGSAVPTTTTQRVRSWLPGTHLSVTVGVADSRVRLGGDPAVPVDASRRVRRAPIESPTAIEIWGTAHGEEIASGPGPADAVRLVRGLPTRRCAWCTAPVASTVCPRCGNAQRGTHR